MALAFGVKNLFPSSLEDGQVLFADGSRQGPAFATLTKSSGTISLLASTENYDTAGQFADIPFLKNELGINNIVEIQVWLDNQGTKSLGYRIDLQDTTATPNNTEVSTATATANYINTRFAQSPDTTDIILSYRNFTANTSVSSKFEELDSNDSNVFTTEWTMRLNFKYSDNLGAGTTKIKYLVLIHHS